MKCTILDCYTDEPAGLGVPPYIGVYPRYLAGQLFDNGHTVEYLTIDDIREPKKQNPLKTDIKRYNLTGKMAQEILGNTDELYVICGVHVPGKYLSALPGTLFEVNRLLNGVKCRKILTGPAATEFGTQLEGGKKAKKNDVSVFDDVFEIEKDYDSIAHYSIMGAEIIKQIPWNLIAEIETARGCRKDVACSFCTEPLKNRFEFRRVDDIVNEVEALYKLRVKDFRLGKQSDFFSWSAIDMKNMLSRIRNLGVRTLHIDNVDPVQVTEEKVKIVVKYCTPGNVAALGVETFDSELVRRNNLNSKPEVSMRAIRIINEFGSEIGENGMPKFLPGLNILFGLKGENKNTHSENMKYMQQILEENLLVRRINVRQVAVFPGTQLFEECGDKFVKKNKRYYWKWRNEIRQKVDNPMLKRLVPVGHILKDVRMEIYDGNTTFGRQIGTYPLIVGVKERLKLGEFYDIEIVGHMLRSVVGKVITS